MDVRNASLARRVRGVSLRAPMNTPSTTMSARASTRSVAWIAGVGASGGLGAALARRFALGGLSVALTGRTLERLETVAAEIRALGGRAHVLPGDMAQESQVRSLAADLAGLGPLRAAVFNAAPFDGAAGEPAAGSLFARTAVNALLAHDADIDSGGTRGSVLFSAAAADAGLRPLARSLADAHEPQGIHVGHVVVDRRADGPTRPDAIAAAYWQLHAQRHRAWTFELDLRSARAAVA